MSAPDLLFLIIVMPLACAAFIAPFFVAAGRRNGLVKTGNEEVKHED
jgi:hypothetical protein